MFKVLRTRVALALLGLCFAALWLPKETFHACIHNDEAPDGHHSHGAVLSDHCALCSTAFMGFLAPASTELVIAPPDEVVPASIGECAVRIYRMDRAWSRGPPVVG